MIYYSSNDMVEVIELKHRVSNSKLMSDIINKYGDYPNQSFIIGVLANMFLRQYEEQK